MDSKDHVHGDEHVTAGKLAGEGLGGAAAGAAGAAIGSFAGPVGTLIGGLAGVVGGWWAGKSAVEASHKYSPEDDRHYRETYESSSSKLADRSYETVRPAYQLGHVAGLNLTIATATSLMSNRTSRRVGRTIFARRMASGARFVRTPAMRTREVARLPRVRRSPAQSATRDTRPRMPSTT